MRRSGAHMKKKVTIALAGVLGLAMAFTGRAQYESTPADAAAIAAIQQAADPSAAVSAYAEGMALNHNDAKFHEAYVRRMVELGLPEMAYHQAQTVTTMEPKNGLAWGVLAYVDARRGQMSEALSAIALAGQYAPNDTFVEHTAGELSAWYDLKADKAQLQASVINSLSKLRDQIGQKPAFVEAYDMAAGAYRAQAAQSSIPSAPAANSQPAAPPPGMASESDQIAPLGYGAPAYAPGYYPSDYGAYNDQGPDYYADYGPGWIAPSPVWWWAPVGYWGGCNFVPFPSTCLFGDFDGFHRHHFEGGFDHAHFDPFGAGGGFGFHGGLADAHNPAFWHQGRFGGGAFFGAPALPSSQVIAWSREGAAVAAATLATTPHWWSNPGQGALALGARPALHSSLPGATVGRRNIPSATVPAFGARSGDGNATAFRSAPRSAWSVPATRSFTAPHWNTLPASPTFHSYGTLGASRLNTAPQFRGASGYPGAFASPLRGGTFGGALPAHTFNPGGFPPGASSMGAFHGGGFAGGGFHPGGFAAGGFHGGGVAGGFHR